MSNEDPHPHKSWLERLTHAFQREPQNRNELKVLLRDAADHHLLDQDTLVMIEGAMRVSEMKVRDIMIPRAQMTTVDHDTTPQQALPTIIDSAHSRFPIIGENRDDVIGILLAKDLLQCTVEKSQTEIKVKDLVRPAVFIPESKRLDVLLKEFRMSRNHMAIVVDEYGGVAGLVTIEDVLEQIVGDIEDEYDVSDEEPNIKQLNQNEYTVKALTSMNEFNNYFSTNIDATDFDTIGDYLMQQFGYVPKRGESIVIGALEMTVTVSSNRRIQLLRIHEIPKT